MAPYVAEHLLRRPDVVGLLPAAYVISGVAAIPLWVRVSRRFGKRETWLAAMWIAAAAFAGVWAVGPGDLALLLALLVVAGAAMGCGGVLSKALLADLIDLDERRTGERKEDVYSAASTLALKVGAAFAITASGPVMSASGFAPNVEQSEASLLGIRLLFAGGLPVRRLAVPGLLARRGHAARDPIRAPAGRSRRDRAPAVTAVAQPLLRARAPR